MTDADVIKALSQVNDDIRRELDAANRLIRELFEENDKLRQQMVNERSKRIAQRAR